MEQYIEPIEKLIEQFRKLDGVGKKTAARMAFSVMSLPKEDALAFSDAIRDAKEKIGFCENCCNLATGPLCPICADATRNKKMICVVEDPRSVMALEKVREYRGVYHVLHGSLSPMRGITPDQLKIAELIERVKHDRPDEIILATNPTVEGEATAMYLSKLLKPYEVRITRIGSGVPVGGDLEYADEVTLFRAMQGRRDI